MDELERRPVQQTVRGEHARVAKQAAPNREVERLTGEMGHTSTGLLDQERASRLVPDGVVESGVGWKPHQQIAGARGDRHVLGLTVHQQRLNISKGAQDTREAFWISMPLCEGLHDPRT
jgi:hypothetical protein